MRRRNLAAFVGVMALLAPIIIGSMWVFANVEHSSNNDRIIEVDQGWNTQQVGDELESQDVIKSYRASDPDSPVIFRRGDMADAEPAVPAWRLAVDELFG